MAISGKAKLNFVATCGLLILVAFAYQESPKNGFHLDDIVNITWQTPLHIQVLTPATLWAAATDGLLENRVIPNGSFAIDWWRGGGEPAPFQWTNLILHALSALAVFALLRTVLGAFETFGARVAGVASFFGAALWAVHPIQVQAVTYIVQRMASMAALFVVLGVLTYLRGRLSERAALPWFILTGVLLALGALSKENAWVSPALLILAELAVVRKNQPLFQSRWDSVLLAAPVVLAVMAAGVLLYDPAPIQRVVAGYEARDFTLSERLLTQPRVLLFHLGQLAWPTPDRFALEHDFSLSTGLFSPWTTFVAIGFWIAWIAAGVMAVIRPKLRPFGFFLLWVPGTLAIESTFWPLEMVFEHRMYLPSVGLAGCVAVGLAYLLTIPKPAVQRGVVFTAILVVGGLVWSTRQRVPVWETELSLWSHVTQVTPTSSRAHNNLGLALWDLERHEEAVASYERAVELDPEYEEAVLNLGRSYATLLRDAEALALFRHAVALYPERAKTHYSLGIFLMERGQFEEARAELLKTLLIQPQHPQAGMFLLYIDGRMKGSRAVHP